MNMDAASIETRTSKQSGTQGVALFPGTVPGQQFQAGRSEEFISLQRPSNFKARVLGPRVMPELLGLWLFEVLLCGALAYWMLVQSESGDLRLSTIAQAMGLALVGGLVSFTVGLYRSDIYSEKRYLPLGAVLGAGLT